MMQELDYQKIGRELKRLRNRYSCTQDQVAQDLGCTVAFISNIENGRTKINLRMLSYYSQRFNTSIDAILAAGRSDTVEQTNLNPQELELIQSFRQFPSDLQELFLQLTEYMISAGRR